MKIKYVYVQFNSVLVYKSRKLRIFEFVKVAHFSHSLSSRLKSIMEGGWLPWKLQKNQNNSPSLDSYGKSLPPPPPGHYWYRKEDGSWQLLKMAHDNGNTLGVAAVDPRVIEHVVMPGDTLQGICLKYRVSAVNIRRLNMFSGNNIQFKTVLLVPVDGGAVVEQQLNTPEVMLQKFRNATGEGIQESRLYLDEHHWDLDKAVSAWRQDEHWEHEATVMSPGSSIAVIDPPTIDEDMGADTMHGQPIHLDDEGSISEEEEEAEDAIAVGSMRRIIPAAAVELVNETIPAFISYQHPRSLSGAAEVSMLELSSVPSASQTDPMVTQPLLSR